MNLPSKLARRAAGATLLIGGLAVAGADEGMWLPDRFPFERVEQAYGFRPTSELIDRLGAATVRFPAGGSGTFVSRDGLLLTAQHVAADCLGALTTPEFDPVEQGFLAATRSDELACSAFDALVLVGIERVSERVRAAAAAAASPVEALAARRRAAAAIEQECAEATGLRCDVVELDSGAEHDLYRYRRLTDVRVAFVPERRLATFGGDVDNFEYPRYWFDFAILRAYDEQGAPYAPRRWLPLARRGAAEGELLLVAGNPGATSRGSTLAQLEWLRDGLYPVLLQELSGLRAALLALELKPGAGSAARRMDLFAVENSLKAVSGYLSGLLAGERMAAVAAEEEALRQAFAATEAARTGEDPWRAIEASVARARSLYPRYLAVERGLGYAGRLAWCARVLLRLAVERERASGERLREYRDAALPVLLAELEAAIEVDPDFEAARLGHALRTVATQLGPLHPAIVGLFAETTPEKAAAAAIAGSRLGDAAFRLRLLAGGREAVEAADDPLLDLQRRFEPLARELREAWDREVTGPETSAAIRLEAIRRELGRARPYPNGSFTLRIGFGALAGYEAGGRRIPPLSRLGGLFERAELRGGLPPFDPAPRLLAARGRLDPELPVNFATTHDIAIGSSGGPIVNRDGEVVGVVFDGNLWLLPNRFAYSGERARTIAVDARAIAATLVALYPGSALFAELYPQP